MGKGMSVSDCFANFLTSIILFGVTNQRDGQQNESLTKLNPIEI